MASLVVFIPAIHTGYIDFFTKHKGVLYIIGSDMLKETSRYPYLERDLRMTDPNAMGIMIESLGIFDTVTVLTPENIARVPEPIIMPEDEVSHEIAEKYFSGKQVAFDSVFLRYGKVITLQEQQVPPHRIVSIEALDNELMAEAARLTKQSSDWWRQIGALIVKNGQIILSAYNRRFPSDYTQDAYGDPRSNFNAGERYDLVSTIHAEASLVAQAARTGVALEGTSLYVTTFPCPTCAKSVIEAGVKKLYYRDGYSLLDAEKILTMAGVEIVLVQ